MSEAHLGKVVDGRYRLDRVLGEGAAGAVYAATQLSVDRTVAVKLLHRADSARFAAEAKAIAKLNHTNVITLHDFGFDEALASHFMVMEYVDGVPLSERMKEVMSTDLILSVALDVASALHHAHSNGVLHRDLKPENVMLARADGRVDVAKVLDFGLAHLLKNEGDADDTAAPADESAKDEMAALEPEEGNETRELESSVVDELLAEGVELPPLASLKARKADDELDSPDTAVLADLDVSSDSVFASREEE